VTRDKEFLLKLADLCEEYDAEFGYTNEDNGVHISVDGREIYCDWMFRGSVAGDLRLKAEGMDAP